MPESQNIVLSEPVVASIEKLLVELDSAKKRLELQVEDRVSVLCQAIVAQMGSEDTAYELSADHKVLIAKPKS